MTTQRRVTCCCVVLQQQSCEAPVCCLPPALHHINWGTLAPIKGVEVVSILLIEGSATESGLPNCQQLTRAWFAAGF
jgi:hypothetical protein